MKPFLSKTIAEQVADHLKREIRESQLIGSMPGVLKLEAEMGVNRKTVEAALQILQRDGLLKPQGAGKRRVIVKNTSKNKETTLKIAFILFDSNDAGVDYFLSLEHQLGEAGHTVIRAKTTLTDLKMDVSKVAQLAAETQADAWLVVSASQEILKWFIENKIPVMAIFGRRHGLPLASVGPNKVTACGEATRQLISLGHRRIVWLTRRIRRIPNPGGLEKAFLNELRRHKINVGDYNLPDWEESVDGLHTCLNSLFRVTPPTAIIADEAHFYLATQNFLSSKGLSVPSDVSLICTDSDSYFNWCKPTIAHIHWDHRPLLQRIIKWANNIKLGKEDKKQTFIPAEFIPGGTIGWAKK